jgi:hypothetical protein
VVLASYSSFTGLNYRLFEGTAKQIGSSCNDSALYSGDVSFESRPGNWIIIQAKEGWIRFKFFPIHYSLIIQQFGALLSELLRALNEM